MKKLTELVEKALAAGATAAEIIRVAEEEKEAFFEKNTLKSVRAEQIERWGIRVLKGRRQASVSTNDPSTLPGMLDEALRLADASPEDPWAGLADARPVEPVPGLLDTRRPVKLAEVLEAAAFLVDTSRAVDHRVSIDSSSASHCRRVVELASSTGIALSEETSSANAFVFGMAADGKDVSSFDYAVDESVSWDTLAGRLAVNAEAFAKAVVGSLGARPAPSFTGEALFGPDVTAEIVGAVGFLASARNVQEKRSRFAGKLGTEVASAVFTLRDEPRVPGSPHSSSFDREGVPTAPLAVIEQGVLRSYLYDTRTAGKDGVASTGHASGGVSGSPSPALHAPAARGTLPLASITANIERGVIVRRFSGNLNPLNGVFSGLVKGGRYVARGRQRHPVTDTMLNSTLDEILANILAVSYETEPTGFGPLPWLLVGKVNVVGAPGQGGA